VGEMHTVVQEPKRVCPPSPPKTCSYSSSLNTHSAAHPARGGHGIQLPERYMAAEYALLASILCAVPGSIAVLAGLSAF